MRRASRRDGNEAEIVAALRAAGASVTIIGQGDGIPDLLVGYRGVTLLLEVKLPLGPEGGRRAGGCSRPGMGGDGTLTRDQLDWWDGWRGAPPVIVRTPAEALAAIGVDASEPLIEVCNLTCRCGFDYLGIQGAPGGTSPPPHFATETDRAARLPCAEVDLSRVHVAPSQLPRGRS